MVEVIDWLKEATGMTQGTLMWIAFMVGAALFTIIPKLFSRWRYRHQASSPQGDENEALRLIRQHAPGMLSAAELAKLKQFTSKSTVGFESSVVIRGADLKQLGASGNLDEQEQVLEFMGGNHSRIDGVEVKFDAEGKPVQVLVNGQSIDLR